MINFWTEYKRNRGERDEVKRVPEKQSRDVWKQLLRGGEGKLHGRRILTKFYCLLRDMINQFTKLLVKTIFQ